LSRICDVIGETGQALIKYLKFVLDETDCPIFVDSTNRRAIFDAFRFFKGSDAMQRLVYNSVDYYHRDAEFEEIKQLGINNVVVLAFTIHHVKIEDKLALLLGANWEKTLALEKPFTEGLLGKVIKAGVKNILLDVGVLDLRSIAESAVSIRQLKEKVGLPCGCAPVNALFNWQKSNEEKLLTQNAVISSAVAAYNSIIYQGADWLLYGPMRCAEWAYPAIGVANSLIAYGALQYGIQPNSNNHPLYKI
jgi:tetrahydromethanopterin S-methyltransferase subunit H